MAQFDDLVPDPGAGFGFGIFARVVIDAAVKRVQVAYPARVLAYYPPDAALGDPAMVDVQIARKYARQVEHEEDAKDGEEVRKDREYGLLAVADMPPVPRVVVHYPGFAGMRMTGPVPVGEEGLLITCHRSIDRWVRRGSDPVQDPVFPHAFNLKDSIFLPGLRAGADEGFDVVPAAGWRLGADDGSWELLVDADTHDLSLTTTGATLTVDGATEVKLGADATSFAAKADLVTAKFTAFKSAISSAPTALGDGGATFKAAIMTALNLLDFGVAATKAKVE